MSSQKYLLVSLLLFGLSNFNLAENSILETKFASNENNCNETQADKFLSLLENVTMKTSQSNTRVLVLTDSELNIYQPLRERLKKEGALFIHLHRTFNEDLRRTLKLASILHSAVNVKFIIHANSIKKASNIFQNVTHMFSNVSILNNNIGFLLTLKTNGSIDEMVKKLNDFAQESNRSDVLNVINLLTMRKKVPIAIFNNQSIENNLNIDDFIATLLNYRIKNEEFRLNRYKFNFNQQIQEEINCAIETISKRISYDMDAFSQDFPLYIHSSMRSNLTYNSTDEDSHFDKVATTYNNLWHFSRNTSNYSDSPINYLKNFTECFNYFADYITEFRNTTYLEQNVKILNLLFFIAGDVSLRAAVETWSQPLKNFKVIDIKSLKNWYQKIDGDLLYPRKVQRICTVNTEKKWIRLRITGYVLKLSDIKIDNCDGNVQITEDSSLLIELFAVEKVLIDVDFRLVAKDIQLTIIAPTWEVHTKDSIGSRVTDMREIRLNGKNANNFANERAHNGVNGLAGLPGNPGGIFHGVADKVINPQKLIVFASGGDGGQGQHGGHGVKGRQGETYKLSTQEFNCTNETGNFLENWQVSSKGSGSKGDIFVVHGKEGLYGGRGGNGGAGGSNGQKGIIIFAELSQLHRDPVFVTAMDGTMGENGKGGEPSQGEKGDDSLVYCRPGSWFSRLFSEDKKTLEKSTPKPFYFNETIVAYARPKEKNAFQLSLIETSKALEGKAGVSLKKRKTPKSPRILQDFPSSINEYKMFARPLLASLDFSDRKDLAEFYHKLNTHEEITKLDNTTALVKEFAGLEKQFFHLFDKVNLTESYETLRQRISNHRERHNNFTYNKEQRRVIEKLELDIILKINGGVTQKPYRVSVNIEKQFGTLYTLRSNLKELESLNIVLQELNKRIIEINDLIEDANNLINEDLRTTMEELELSLDQGIDTLLVEITQLKAVQLKQKEDLYESREKLKNIIKWKKVFGVLKIGCGLLGMVNPAMGIAATVVSSSLTFVEQDMTGKDISTRVAEIPKAVKAFTSSTEDFLKQKKNKKDKVSEIQKEYISNLLKDATPEGKEIIESLLKSKENLENSNANHTEKIKVYDETQMKMTEELEKAKKEGSMKKVKDYIKSIDAVKCLKATTQIFETGADIVKNIVQDKGKIDEINKAMSETQQNLNNLDKLEKDVYDVTQPMLGNMMENLNEMSQNMSSMNNKNRLALNKWKVSETISEVKKILQNSVDGLNTTDDITSTLQKVLSVFDVMNTMFKLISDYNEKKEDKISEAKIHTAISNNFILEDKDLLNAVLELKTLISYNYLYFVYNNWQYAFKQFTFPYGATVLKDNRIANTIESNNIYDIISKVKWSIDEVFKKIMTDQIENNDLRKYLHAHDYLGSRSIHKQSFFIWENKTNVELISEILSGKQVELRSLIPVNSYEAIKFTLLYMQFTSKNSTLQKKLYKVMSQGFIIVLTHNGDSVYKFNNKVYEIKTAPEVIKFHHPVNKKDPAAKVTNNYEQFSLGDSILSPYASWTVEITNQNPKVFKKLKQFVGEVDLELVGKGYYVDDFKCSDECEKDVQRYYKYVYNLSRVDIQDLIRPAVVKKLKA